MASILDRMPTPLRRRRNVSQPPPPPPVESEESFVEMTLQEHLEELRKRILYSAISVLVALGIGLWLSGSVLEIMANHAQTPGERLQVISPTEGFVTYFKVALYIAIAIAMPVLVYQLLAFIFPGLTKGERKYVMLSVPFVMILFAGGVSFAFFVLVPRALDFLSGFGSSYFEWNPRAEEIISFYMRLMLGVGIIFQLPLVMYIPARIGIIGWRRYAKFRKYALILAMIAAAIITPTPDPFNMMLVAVPTYVLFELGILLSMTVRKTVRASA